MKEPTIILKPPPPPPAPLSPVSTAQKAPANFPSNFSLQGTTDDSDPHGMKECQSKEPSSQEDKNSQDTVEDHFGDFHTADQHCFMNLKFSLLECLKWLHASIGKYVLVLVNAPILYPLVWLRGSTLSEIDDLDLLRK
ncbi:uncharacterized protein LOC131251209 [Magnolia sinica]|uniref:uncharacterized protein LOC131251209 n=1 Tax=Magnolia sinica TaxID=86752 RepID=UPI0026587E65|nr:uncharacterized protein LOC131251209 [Magnolia sinica]